MAAAMKSSAAVTASAEIRCVPSHLSTVAPDSNEHGPEVLQQLVTRDVAKYRKLLEEK